jgi:hypothetical protein
MIVHILEQGLSVPNGVKYPEWGIVLEMESSPVIDIKEALLVPHLVWILTDPEA